MVLGSILTIYATLKLFEHEARPLYDLADGKNILSRTLYVRAAQIPSFGEIARKRSWNLYERATFSKNSIVSKHLATISLKLMC